MLQRLITTDPGAGQLVAGQGLPLDQNPAAVYLAGLGKGGRRTMKQALDAIARRISGGQLDALALNWAALDFQHTAAIRAWLAETYSPATGNKMLAALRGTLRAAYNLGQLDADHYRRATALDAIKGERLPTGRNLTPGEIAALFAVCANDPTPAGARDAALLALLRLGLRRAEVAGLQVGDHDQAGESVKVRGKGNKDRAVPLVGGAAEALGDWLLLRGDIAGPLLLQVDKAGRIIPQGLSGQAIYNVLRKRAEQAGVKDLSPHDWRRTFAGDLLDAGADLVTVQKLMGHASPTTTGRYDRRGEAARRKAAELLHVPYRRRTLPGV